MNPEWEREQLIGGNILRREVLWEFGGSQRANTPLDWRVDCVDPVARCLDHVLVLLYLDFDRGRWASK
jgi:hypothetical protein